MRTARLRWTAAVALAALLSLAPLAAQAGDSRRVLKVAVGRHVVKASPGTQCTPHRDASGARSTSCAEAVYPLTTRGRLVLRPGQQVRMRFGAGPSVVGVALLRTGGEGTVLALGNARRTSERRRFVWRLPRKLACATQIIDMSVRYPGSGDINFWAAARVAGCPR